MYSLGKWQRSPSPQPEAAALKANKTLLLMNFCFPLVTPIRRASLCHGSFELPGWMVLLWLTCFVFFESVLVWTLNLIGIALNPTWSEAQEVIALDHQCRPLHGHDHQGQCSPPRSKDFVYQPRWSAGSSVVMLTEALWLSALISQGRLNSVSLYCWKHD